MQNIYRNIIIAVILGVLIASLSQNPSAGILMAMLFILIPFLKKMKMKKMGKEKKHKKEEEDIVDIKTPFPTIGKVYLAIILIFLAIVVDFFRPWFHDFIIAFYINPMLTSFIIFLAVSIVLFLKYKKYTVGAIFLVLTVLSFLTLSFSPIIEQVYIVNENTYNKIDTLPDTTDVRILPRVVAFRYLEDSLQKSRERIGGINVVDVDGTIFWMAPRVPDGAILYLTQKVNGVMTADATKTDRTTKLVTKTLNIGEEIGIFDNIYWNLYNEKYFINLGDIYYLYEKNHILTVAPIIAYKFKFPVMIPYYKGVFVLDEQGKISYYTPSQVEKIEEFKDNRAYPGELSRLYVDSYKYNLGVINTWFLHKDQIEISDVYGSANRQPFLLPTEDGLKWIIATEPYGESYGVFKIFLVDAITGKIDMLELDEDQTLTGPVRVISYVKKKFPRIDWSTTRIVEPRPFVVNNKLYWMLSITPNDFAGITYTVFVNSENNEVIAFDNDEGVYSFVKQGIIKEITEDTEEKTKEELREEKISEIEKLLDEIKSLE